MVNGYFYPIPLDFNHNNGCQATTNNRVKYIELCGVYKAFIPNWGKGREGNRPIVGKWSYHCFNAYRNGPFPLVKYFKNPTRSLCPFKSKGKGKGKFTPLHREYDPSIDRLVR